MVVVGMKQMSLDNQRLNHMKNRVVKTEQRSKVVEESLGVITQKYRETSEENTVLMRRIKEKHLEHEEEVMVSQRLHQYIWLSADFLISTGVYNRIN